MKKSIFILVIGMIIGISVSVGAVYLYNAKDIEYTNTNSTATNVQDALIEITDDLLVNEADLLWSNSDITASFPAQTMTLDLTEYKYVIVETCHSYTSCVLPVKTIIKVGERGTAIGPYLENNYQTTLRFVDVSTTGLTFSTGKYYEGGNHENSAWAIPYHIWGVKHLNF